MARRSVRVTASVRKSQETRSQTRSLSTFPYVQNAPSVAQARLRGVRARRHNCGAPAPVKIKIKFKLNVTDNHFVIHKIENYIIAHVEAHVDPFFFDPSMYA